jgi:ParB family chromosome partitioning protein
VTRRHDTVYEDVLRDLDEKGAPAARAQARFIRRSAALSEQGERRETVLRLVEPERCRMWGRHNRDYARLTPENCADLIEGIKAQNGQEFPAIVRRLPEGDTHEWEVICGARRHFAVSWLRANTYPQFRYLIEERELTDEEAFRLADIENRDRADISDYERAKDYAAAIELYYDGQQKKMAERLEVSASWLSRYLQCARLPDEIVAAFASPHEMKELHARELRPLLAQGWRRRGPSRASVRAGQGARARRRSWRGCGRRASRPGRRRRSAPSIAAAPASRASPSSRPAGP